jgi:hypothetical protein
MYWRHASWARFDLKTCSTTSRRQALPIIDVFIFEEPWLNELVFAMCLVIIITLHLSQEYFVVQREPMFQLVLLPHSIGSQSKVFVALPSIDMSCREVVIMEHAYPHTVEEL